MAKSVHSAEYDAFLALLKERREKLGITQIEIGATLKMTQSAVSKVERGERRLDVIELRQWCQGLGISFSGFTRELDRRLDR